MGNAIFYLVNPINRYAELIQGLGGGGENEILVKVLFLVGNPNQGQHEDKRRRKEIQNHCDILQVWLGVKST